MSLDLYSKYVSEREGLQTISEDFGFITFRPEGNECFLSDIFIDAKFRSTGACRKLLSLLCDAAVKSGCDHVSANIFQKDKRCSETLAQALSLGFKVGAFNIGSVTIILDLKGVK